MQRSRGDVVTSVKIASKNGLAIEALGTTTDGKPKPVRFKFRTDLLLKELQATEAFSILFLSDPDGKVLYQEAPSQRRWLRFLRWGEQEFRDANASGPGSVQLRDLPGVLGTDGKAAWLSMRAASSRSSVRLGGEMQQTYLQPVGLSGSDNPELVLGGFVPTQNLLREALALDSYFLSALLFLMLLGTLGFPFIKLLVLNPHERFRQRDVYLLYLSSGALLSLLTLLVLSWDGYLRWAQVADTGLRDLASSIQQTVRREVTQARDQLAVYDELAMTSPSACTNGPVHRDWFRDPAPVLPFPKAPIYVEQGAWVDPTGKQVWKVTARRAVGLTSVAPRAYFRAVRDGSLFRVPGWGDRPFFLGPEWSITDGKFYTFVSIESKWKTPVCAPNPSAPSKIVAVATVKLLSLDRPALPAGYGFAIINREGRVLYHSDNRVSLRENFFEEMGDGAKARSVVFAGDTLDFDDSYRERSHRVFLSPLEGSVPGSVRTGLYVAVFRDLAIERAAVAHALVTSVGGPMAAMVLVMLLAPWIMGKILKTDGGRTGSWLWPHEGLQQTYRALAMAYGAVFVLGLLLYLTGVGEAVFLLMPLAAGAVGIAVYSRMKSSVGPRDRLSTKLWQTAQLCLFLLCVVVTPSSALFRLIMGHEFGKTIQMERAWVEGQKADARMALEAEMRAEEHPAWVIAAAAERRGSYHFTPPQPFNIDPPVIRGASHWIIEAHESLDHALPVESDLIARQRYQLLDRTYSPPGLFGLPISGWGLLGLAAIFGVLVWWIHWNTNRLFLADLNAPEALPAAAPEALWDACSIEERQVLMQVEREHIANPKQRELVAGLVRRGLLVFAPSCSPPRPA